MDLFTVYAISVTSWKVYLKPLFFKDSKGKGVLNQGLNAIASGGGQMATSVYDNLLKVRERIERAARKVGREPDEITLVAVTKTVDLKLVRAALKAGVRVFGENYVQESEEKIKKIRHKEIKWHFIGHLQKNKAKFAVALFDLIHTVDTPGLAKELNKRTEEPLDILIQVKLSDEKTKGGVAMTDVVGLAEEIAAMKNLRLKGLMAIPPPQEKPEDSRPYFTTLRRMAEKVNREVEGVHLTELSMGMSNDFEIAIEEGATMIRVGTSLFGEREPKKEKTEKGK